MRLSSTSPSALRWSQRSHRQSRASPPEFAHNYAYQQVQPNMSVNRRRHGRSARPCRPPSSIIGRTAWPPCRVPPVTSTLGLGTRVAMPSRFDIALNPERPEVGRAWGVRGTRSRHGSLRSLGNESTGSYLSRSGQGAAVQPSRRKERGSLPVGSRKTRVGAGHKGASRRRAAPRSQPGTDSCKLLGRCVCQHRWRPLKKLLPSS
jgi:hypothetical protein